MFIPKHFSVPFSIPHLNNVRLQDWFRECYLHKPNEQSKEGGSYLSEHICMPYISVMGQTKLHLQTPPTEK